MTTALYRRYRPDSFADVIGQEHVTDPLRAALRADRATHAYLFSGPRGCGKTTSARILARCLNCAEGPTDTPCGVCASCVELARGGPGSLDVVEIDAASHGGVDDARDLRERAVFAPARDRYKVFIIDEAHMVTPQGFNALLKLVEEPPAHVKFVFATTEPEKVIGTIRSRTHHYPFRLVPPAVLQGYLGTLCEAESIAVENGVLPLVVRAGGGSVRDSLSVLDQLMAGAADTGLSYDLASALLGFTPVTLLDDAVGALAAGDGAALFRVVDHVVESGRDPRRFVEDLLDRLRDLIVIAASGNKAETVLRALPADEVERMRPQAGALGAHRLSTVADIVNTGLTEMVGATSPRLLLELVLTRAMLAIGGLGQAPGPVAAPASTPAATPIATVQVPPRPAATAPEAPAEAQAPAHAPAAAAPARKEEAPSTPREEEPRRAPAPAKAAAPSRQPEAPRQTEPPRPTDATDAEPAAGAGGGSETPSAADAAAEAESTAGAVDGTELRRRWPEVLQTLAGANRTAWTLISQHAQPGEVTADSVTLLFPTSGLISAFTARDGGTILSQAIFETVGLRLRVVVDVAGPDGTPSGGGTPSNSGGSGPAAGGGKSAAGGARAPQGEARSGGGRPPASGSAGDSGDAVPTAVVDEFGPEPTDDPFGPEDPFLDVPAAHDEPVIQAAPAADKPAAPPQEAPAVLDRVVSDAVARALADWNAEPGSEPAADAARISEDEVDDAVAAEMPHVRAHLRMVAPTAAPPSSGDDAPAGTATPEMERGAGASAGEPTQHGARLAPVIDLTSRTRAQRDREAEPDLPPAPWEDDEEYNDAMAGSASQTGPVGPAGATLVAKMLGGVVIDELVDGVSDMGR